MAARATSLLIAGLTVSFASSTAMAPTTEITSRPSFKAPVIDRVVVSGVDHPVLGAEIPRGRRPRLAEKGISMSSNSGRRDSRQEKAKAKDKAKVVVAGVGGQPPDDGRKIRTAIIIGAVLISMSSAMGAVKEILVDRVRSSALSPSAEGGPKVDPAPTKELLPPAAPAAEGEVTEVLLDLLAS